MRISASISKASRSFDIIIGKKTDEKKIQVLIFAKLTQILIPDLIWSWLLLRDKKHRTNTRTKWRFWIQK